MVPQGTARDVARFGLSSAAEGVAGHRGAELVRVHGQPMFYAMMRWSCKVAEAECPICPRRSGRSGFQKKKWYHSRSGKSYAENQKIHAVNKLHFLHREVPPPHTKETLPTQQKRIDESGIRTHALSDTDLNRAP